MHICLLLCITEEVAIRENVEIVYSMADVYHDHAPVIAFLHSMDMCVLIKREGGKKLPPSVSERLLPVAGYVRNILYKSN